MKKVISVLTSLLIVAALLIGVTNCKKDNPTFNLSTLVAGTIDLNGATPANTVPANPTIEATFSVDVDATTATNAFITLVRDYDGAAITLTITTAGKKITIVPDEDLGNGALYVLSFLNGLKATDGQLLTLTTRAFTTEGNFVPAGVMAYWSFENNPDDQVGAFDPVPADVIDITYADSYKTTAGKAASFNGSTSLIEIPNGDVLMNTSDFTLSFWVKANSAYKTNGHFVMGLAGWFGFQFEIFGDYTGCKLAAQYELGDGTSASEDLWFPANGDLGWQGWTYCRDLTAAGGLPFLIQDKWAQVICVYNSTTKVGTMYINGDKMKSQDFNLWPDGDAKKGVVGLKYAGNAAGNQLAFGFIQGRNNRTISDAWADYADINNNHFKGLLDDIRIFQKVLTETEISLMYASEKP
jgi:hypothetical protein